MDKQQNVTGTHVDSNFSEILNHCMIAAAEETNPVSSINVFLRELGNGTGADRCYIFELNRQGNFDNTYEYCRSGVISLSNMRQNKLVEPFVGWMDNPVGEGKSALLPFYIDSRIQGYLAFDKSREDYSDNIISILQSAAEFVSVLISHKDNADFIEGAVHTDPVTGLLNLVVFQQFVNDLLEDGSINADDYCIICLNIKHFKIYNNQFGYAAGNQLLRKMGKLIRNVVKTEHVTRSDADHFYAVVETSNAEYAVRAIHDGMKNNGRDSVSVYAGIYLIKKDESQGAIMLDRAKLAADQTSDDFANYYMWFDPAMEDKLKRDSYLISHVDEAVEKGWVKVYYQPIVDTLSRKVTAVEALSRWIDPNFGFLNPGQFINTLEEARLLYKIDLYILECVCKDIRASEDAGKRFCQVSINLSRHDLSLPDLHEKINAIMEKYKVSHDSVHLEITESALISNEKIVQDHIVQFHKDGFEVWLDDFGSGYSSLNTLQNYDFDCVKIDMLFLRESNQRTPMLVRSIVDMAKHLGMLTLTEGVETDEQYDFLESIGCTFAQGYKFSKPETLEKLISGDKLANYDMESPSERIFYRQVGRVNVLDSVNPTSKQESDELPVCIVEYYGDVHEVLYSNAICRSYITAITGRPAEEVTARSPERTILTDTLKQLREQTERTGKAAVYDYIFSDVCARMSVQFITEYNSHKAYFIKALSVTPYRENRISGESSVKDLYSLYDSVDVIFPEDDMIKHLYGSMSDVDKIENVGLNEAFKTLAASYVHPAEQSRYYDFVDIETLEERVDATPSNAYNGFFHIKQTDGTYRLRRIVISKLSDNDGKKRYIMCDTANNVGWSTVALRKAVEMNAVPDDIGDGFESDTIIRNDSLWHALTNQERLGLFWKDKNRRFIGANNAFLHYYGMTLADILGKNDEDMHWHPDPIPFKLDEESVLKEGKVTTEAMGECLVEGEVRKIMASKAPVYEKGKIVGLVGYFVDVTNAAERSAEFKSKQNTDPETKLQNFNGMIEEARQYEKNYKKGGPNFAFITLQTMGFNRFRETFGTMKYHLLINKICDTLKASVPENSIIGHPSGGRFGIITFCKDQQELSNIIGKIDKAIASIHEVEEHTPVTLYFVSGGALYSEGMDLDEVIALSEQRMKAPSYMLYLNGHITAHVTYDNDRLAAYLSESQKRFSDSLWTSMIDKSNLCMFWKDSQRRFVGANRSFLEYFDLKLTDVIGRTAAELGLQADKDTIELSEEQIIREGISVMSMTDVITGGNLHSCVYSGAPVFDNEKVAGLLGVLIDTTRVK